MSEKILAFAFVPGLLSTSRPWLPAFPASVQIVPVEYFPHKAVGYQHTRSNADFFDVAALRLLAVALELGSAGTWAVGGHSLGGLVVYQFLEYFMKLFESDAASVALLETARDVLGFEDSSYVKLLDLVNGLQRNVPRMPLGVFSFEGTLTSLDVGVGSDWVWSIEYSRMESPSDEGWVHEALSDPKSKWTWDMVRSSCTAAYRRCASSPPRSLQMLRNWLLMPNSPGMVYIAGARSKGRNQAVFPVLRSVSSTAGQQGTIHIVTIPDAGHNIERDNPAELLAAIARELDLPIASLSNPRTSTIILLTLGIVFLLVTVALLRLRKLRRKAAQRLDQSNITQQPNASYVGMEMVSAKELD